MGNMQLDVQGTIFLADADPTRNIEANLSREAPASPTKGPNRHTIYVPSDNATLSLGEACPDDRRRIADRGITGRTDTHVHLHVTNSPATIVSLGGPATEVTASVLASHDSRVPHASHGYAMVTDANAWHDALGQHYVVSREKDVVLRAAGSGAVTSLLQADNGTAVIEAGSAIYAGSKGSVTIVAHPSVEHETMTYDEKVEGHVQASCTQELQEFVGAHHSNLKTIVMKATALYRKVRNPPKPAKRGFAKQVIQTAVDLVKDTKALHDLVLAELGLLPAQKTSNVNVLAKDNLHLFAKQAFVYGKKGTSVSSDETVGISGKDTSVNAKAKVGISAGKGITLDSKEGVDIGTQGALAIEAAKDTSISSKTANVKIAAQRDAQLNANEGALFLHGAKSVYCAGGGATSHGLLVNDKRLHLGRFTNGTEYGSPSKDLKKRIYFNQKTIGIENDKCQVRVHRDKVTVEGDTEVMLKARKKNVTINGTKIKLG